MLKRIQAIPSNLFLSIDYVINKGRVTPAHSKLPLPSCLTQIARLCGYFARTKDRLVRQRCHAARSGPAHRHRISLTPWELNL